MEIDDIKKPEEEIIDSVEEKEEEVIEPKEEETAEETPVDAEEEAAEEESEETTEEEAPADEPSEEEEKEESVEDEKIEENKDEGVQFSLEDFQNLQESLASLTTQFNELQSKYDDMTTSYNELVEFKKAKDREEKQAMIDQFYMLSDAEKKDVQDNIDQYSLDEIEAKLSIICVHNKLDLSGKTDSENNLETTFSLDSVEDDSEDTNIPALVSALRKNRKSDK